MFFFLIFNRVKTVKRFIDFYLFYHNYLSVRVCLLHRGHLLMFQIYTSHHCGYLRSSNALFVSISILSIDVAMVLILDK